jgi:hypothetical protein
MDWNLLCWILGLMAVASLSAVLAEIWLSRWCSTCQRNHSPRPTNPDPPTDPSRDSPPPTETESALPESPSQETRRWR